MSTPGDSAILRSSTEVEAVSALILVENSKPMVSLWPELQSNYIPSMLAAIRVAHPVTTPIQVMMLHSGPVTDPSPSSPTSHINFNEVPNIPFNLDPSNRITPQNVRRAIELLSASTQRRRTSCHLIIAAASNPSNGGSAARAGAPEWQLLGQRLAEHGIQCHVIINMVPCSNGFSQLFFINLQLQNHQRVEPWFPVDQTRYTFLLSSSNGQHSMLPSPLTSQHGPEKAALPSRSGVHSLQTQSPLPSSSSPLSSSIDEPVATLVKELQKAHGISKKKGYGSSGKSKAVSASRGARERYRGNIPSLTVPSTVSSTRSAATLLEADRSSNRSISDRRKRSQRGGHAASDQPPMEATMRQGQGAEWVHHSPGTDSSPSCSSATLSPGSSGSREPASPAPPIHRDATYYAAALPSTCQATTVNSHGYVQPTTVAPSLASSSLASALGPPPSELPPAATMPDTSSGTHPTSPEGSYSQWDSTVPFEPSAPSHSMGAMSGKYRLDSMAVPSAGNVSRAADFGDVPFILSPEYEAETAAKLRAALASSQTQSRIPSHSPPMSTDTSRITLTTSTASAGMTRKYTTTAPAPGIEAQGGAYAHLSTHTQSRGHPPLELEGTAAMPAYTYNPPFPIAPPGFYGTYGTYIGEGAVSDSFANEQYDSVAAYPVAPRSMTAFGTTTSSLQGWAG